VYNPCIGEFATGQAMNAVPHLLQFRDLYGLNNSFVDKLVKGQKQCGWDEYLGTYLKFPPPKNQPPMYMDYRDPKDASCAFDSIISSEVYNVNTCFNPYSIVSYAVIC
jgi:carboxypeptidase D